MTVIVNGDPTDVPPEESVAALVARLGLPERGVAVAVDGEVVPKGRWSTLLRNNSQIEIVTAVQGG
ncbi:sulfur carrier protein ThiS [Gordonia sp. NPDC003424]